MTNRRFKFLGSPSGYTNTGMWVAKTDDPTTWAVIYADLWAEHVSEAEAKEMGTYLVDAGLVFLDESHRPAVEAALKSCGWELYTSTDGYAPIGSVWCPHSGDIVARKSDKHYTYVLIEACWRYGHRELWTSESGNNFRKLMRRARYEVG